MDEKDFREPSRDEERRDEGGDVLAQVADAVARWRAAFAAGDFDAFVRCYAPNAQAAAEGGPLIKGRPAIAAYFAHAFAIGFAGLQLAPLTIREQPDGLVVAIGRWSTPATDGGGGRRGGDWINLMERSDEGWRILLHTWSFDVLH